MSDELTPVVVPETPESTPEPAPIETPVVVETPPAPTPPTWQEELEKADAKLLRSHPKIAGMIGSERQRAVQEHEERTRETQSQRVREQTEAELLKFSEDNADYLKQHYPKAYAHLMGLQQERARREVDGLRGKTVHELATTIGRAYQNVPEWKELTPEDHENLARAVIGKPDNEVLAIFSQKALELLADRRAERKATQKLEEYKAKDREALRQEEAAKLLRTSEAPDTARPKGAPVAVNIKNMSDAEFDTYWNSKHR